MEKSKICFKCNQIKPLSDYYKHKGMGDGHLNKCKECTKKDTKSRADVLSLDDKWTEKERKRHREKYHRLNYLEKHKPSTDAKKVIMERYVKKYPEKQLAKNACSKMKSEKGHLHHWSYLEKYRKDVIDISSKDHMKAHRFIVYDQERMMYRRIDNNELLDTKQKHIDWITYCINNKED